MERIVGAVLFFTGLGIMIGSIILLKLSPLGYAGIIVGFIVSASGPLWAIGFPFPGRRK